MNRFAEFIARHPLLASVVLLLAAAAVAIEWRHRRQGATALGPLEAVRAINAGAVVIDVRAADAYAAGHIIDARHIPQADLQAQSDALLKKYREKPLLLYCDTGASSAAAARQLKALGLTKVVNLRGGLAAWRQENLPTVASNKTSAKVKNGKKDKEGA